MAGCVLVACGSSTEPTLEPLLPPDHVLDVRFNSGLGSWLAGIADYPPHLESHIGFVAEHVTPDDSRPGGYFLSGNNGSDDLFMFIKSPVSGLEPGTFYEVRFDVEFGTNSPSNCSGAGGAPGEGVWVKAGAVSFEPLSVLDEEDEYLRMNVDIGHQMNDGEHAVIVGDVGNGLDCIKEWREKELSGDTSVRAQADDEGRLWLLIGTDSGFESRTDIVFTRVTASFWVLDGGP